MSNSDESRPWTVGSFFDALTDDYTTVIERCFPRYREMLWALLDYLPSGREFGSIVELGCGTGNLSVLLREAFPSASLTLVDLSGESLDVCRERLGDGARFDYRRIDFRELECDEKSVDLAISSIALHHLTSAEKRTLFRRIHGWLASDGVLSFADQFAGATGDLSSRHLENWKRQSFAAGSNEDEWAMWMQHQDEHDYHDTLTDQIDWLRDAGFPVIDCPWRCLLWTVLQARKE